MPALARDVEFSCGRGRFVSVVKAVCHTQLGNQLSAYAALLYFTARHGYHAVLDPFQLKIIGAVFRRVETVNCDCDYVKIMSVILRTASCFVDVVKIYTQLIYFSSRGFVRG